MWGAGTEPGSPRQQSGRSHQAFLEPGGWGPGPHLWGATGRPTAVGTRRLLAPHLMRPVTPRQTPGHQRPQGPQDRLPPGPEERDIPAGCVSGGPPPQPLQMRTHLRGPEGALKGHFPGVTENTNRLDGSHSNAARTGLKTLTWTHMLELIDPDPHSFSKYSWSSCYLPGSVLGIWGGSENKSENPPPWSPHPAGCGQTVNCECAKEGAHTDWEV